MLRTLAIGTVLLAAAGTVGAEEAGAGPHAFSLGLVQRALQAGLSQAEVVERLGSPNILTRDAAGREAWVYDRVSTERQSDRTGFWLGGGAMGGGANVAGGVATGGGRQKEKSTTSQRTLTVVVRFSAAGAVESYSWHESRF